MVALRSNKHPQYVEAGRSNSAKQQAARVIATADFKRGRKVYVNGDKSVERAVDWPDTKRGIVYVWIKGDSRSYHPSVLELIPVPEK